MPASCAKALRPTIALLAWTGSSVSFDNAAEEVAIAARRILRRKLHIVGEAARELHGVHRRREALLARDAQLGREVQVRRGEKRVNARARGGGQRARRLLDILTPGA